MVRDAHHVSLKPIPALGSMRKLFVRVNRTSTGVRYEGNDQISKTRMHRKRRRCVRKPKRFATRSKRSMPSSDGVLANGKRMCRRVNDTGSVSRQGVFNDSFDSLTVSIEEALGRLQKTHILLFGPTRRFGDPIEVRGNAKWKTASIVRRRRWGDAHAFGHAFCGGGELNAFEVIKAREVDPKHEERARKRLQYITRLFTHIVVVRGRRTVSFGGWAVERTPIHPFRVHFASGVGKFVGVGKNGWRRFSPVLRMGTKKNCFTPRLLHRVEYVFRFRDPYGILKRFHAIRVCEKTILVHLRGPGVRTQSILSQCRWEAVNVIEYQHDFHFLGTLESFDCCRSRILQISTTVMRYPRRTTGTKRSSFAIAYVLRVYQRK